MKGVKKVTYNLYHKREAQELLITSSLEKEWLVIEAELVSKFHPDMHLIVKDSDGKVHWESG